ncbi:hypothetical protein [Prevotella sp. KH2C16]|uniref:hypothetical protein n=1 Tax=Prevotella sp. KH2C16 TaxID=1855325 RepID=UPI0008F18A50|nr:hypothetical protein [Prevotella sp. KH2C16]SFF96462.1 hypothetical protein SAMN05216383_1036 [Prevotella sp. KH2C16]
MSYKKGKNLMLFINGKSIAAATTCTNSFSANTTEVTNKDTADGMTDIEVTTISGTLHTENMFTVGDSVKGLGYFDLFDLMKAKTPIDFTYQDATPTEDGVAPANGWEESAAIDDYLSGKCFLTSLDTNAPNGETATFTADFTITGDVKHIKKTGA